MTSIDLLKEEIEQKFKHSFLDKHVGKPYINSEKLWFLHELMDDFHEEKKKNYIYTTTLVEIALDIHDQIEKENKILEFNQANRKTQLTVLAGDYFSGLYYYLLSMTEDIDYIQVLAKAIKKINEEKIKLYCARDKDIHYFIQQFLKIDFLLLESVVDYFDCSEDVLSIFELLHLKRLQNEYKNINEKNYSFIYTHWLKDHRNISLNHFANELKEQINDLEMKLFKWDKNSIKKNKLIYSALQNKKRLNLINFKMHSF